MRPIGLVKNLFLAASTVTEHLWDDPAVLALQLSRRFPSPLGHALAEVAKIAPGVVLPSMAAVIQGRTADAEKLLTAAMDRGSHERSMVRLADVATAAALPDLAERLLTAAPLTTRGWAGAQARLRWYRGDMSGAVAVFRDGRTSRAEEKLRFRLNSELEVFDGWSPSLPQSQGYKGRRNTVLHLLTNSLPYTGSGYAQRSHSLLQAQSEHGWRVHAATRLGYPVQVGHLKASATEYLDGITYHRLLVGSLPKGMAARLQLQAEELLKLALEIRPEVLHTTTHFVNGLVVRAVAESLGVPWVYEVRGQLADTWVATRDEEAKYSERYQKFLTREAEVMQAAGGVATLGGAMRKRISHVGVPTDRTILLPNAVAGDFLNEPVTPGVARARLGLPVQGTYMGTVSSLVGYEGLDDLLRAFALLAPDHPDLRCLIVGDGAAAPMLQRLAEEMGLQDRILFPGRVPREMAHMYHQALDIFVVPRKDFEVTRSVTPLKPVEAMASARPVAASDLSALREIVRCGHTGVLFPPGNVEAQALALSGLINDPGRRKSLGDAGRLEAIGTRTWQVNAAASTALYRRLLELK